MMRGSVWSISFQISFLLARVAFSSHIIGGPLLAVAGFFYGRSSFLTFEVSFHVVLCHVSSLLCHPRLCRVKDIIPIALSLL